VCVDPSSCPKAASSVLDAFVEPLREALANAETIGRVERDAVAKALWAAEYKELSCARPGAFGMATGCAHAETLRLSLLYALLNGSDVIRVEHLRAALSLWRYCEASARRIFGLDAASGSGDRCVGGSGSTDTPPLPLHLRLLDIIVKTPGISRKGLHETTGNRIKADDMEAALASLEAQGLADRGRCQPEGGGRPAECWWPAGDDFDGDEGVTFTMNADDSSPSDASPHCLASAALSADRTNKQAPIAMIG
jgi:hypothetical protein